MKHLRQCDFTEAYEALQKKARVLLEHPRLSELHHQLVTLQASQGKCTVLSHQVVEGNYTSAERLMELSAEGIRNYLLTCFNYSFLQRSF